MKGPTNKELLQQLQDTVTTVVQILCVLAVVNVSILAITVLGG